MKRKRIESDDRANKACCMFSDININLPCEEMDEVRRRLDSVIVPTINEEEIFFKCDVCKIYFCAQCWNVKHRSLDFNHFYESQKNGIKYLTVPSQTNKQIKLFETQLDIVDQVFNLIQKSCENKKLVGNSIKINFQHNSATPYIETTTESTIESTTSKLSDPQPEKPAIKISEKRKLMESPQFYLVAPVGAGKTIMTLFLISKIIDNINNNYGFENLKKIKFPYDGDFLKCNYEIYNNIKDLNVKNYEYTTDGLLVTLNEQAENNKLEDFYNSLSTDACYDEEEEDMFCVLGRPERFKIFNFNMWFNSNFRYCIFIIVPTPVFDQWKTELVNYSQNFLNHQDVEVIYASNVRLLKDKANQKKKRIFLATHSTLLHHQHVFKTFSKKNHTMFFIDEFCLNSFSEFGNMFCLNISANETYKSNPTNGVILNDNNYMKLLSIKQTKVVYSLPKFINVLDSYTFEELKLHDLSSLYKIYKSELNAMREKGKVIENKMADIVDETRLKQMRETLKDLTNKCERYTEALNSSCFICFDDFCETIPPIQGTCGHYVCIDCVYRSQTSVCPMCRSARAFEPNTIVNFVTRKNGKQNTLLQSFQDTMEIFEPGSKTLVAYKLSTNDETIRNYITVAEDLGFKIFKIDKMVIGEFKNKIQYFEKDSEKSVMFLNSTMCSYGLNLQFVKNLVILNKIESDNITMEEYKQMIGRCQRYGRKEVLNLYEFTNVKPSEM